MNIHIKQCNCVLLHSSYPKMSVPRVGEKVLISQTEYEVNEVIHDFTNQSVTVKVLPK